MSELTPYGNIFQEALSNISKVLQRCGEINLSLGREKCLFLMKEGVVLRHFISSKGIQVDPCKVAIIKTFMYLKDKEMSEAS